MQLVDYYSIYRDTIGNDLAPKTVYIIDIGCSNM